MTKLIGSSYIISRHILYKKLHNVISSSTHGNCNHNGLFFKKKPVIQKSLFTSLIASKKQSTAPLYYDPLQDYHQFTRQNKEQRILICGDGDLSFGASLALGFKENGQNRKMLGIIEDDDDENKESDFELIVSVLESENMHNQVYKNSMRNIEIIQEECHQKVMFEVDATKLQNYFGEDDSRTMFDRIHFNFPHWRGKQNIRRNRLLVKEFFASATKLIVPGGQIHMALLDHQGGMHAANLSEWKGSWMVGQYAGESQLLLSRVLPYKPDYNLSSYQWRDRPFMLNGKSQMHIFTKADGVISASKDTQLCSYFSLFISIPSFQQSENSSYWSKDEVLDSNFVLNVIKEEIPSDLDSQIELYRMHFRIGSDDQVEITAAEYRVCIIGDKMPITANKCEHYKNLIEQRVQKHAKETRKSKCVVSKVIPLKLLV